MDINYPEVFFGIAAANVVKKMHLKAVELLKRKNAPLGRSAYELLFDEVQVSQIVRDRLIFAHTWSSELRMRDKRKKISEQFVPLDFYLIPKHNHIYGQIPIFISPLLDDYSAKHNHQ